MENLSNQFSFLNTEKSWILFSVSLTQNMCLKGSTVTAPNSLIAASQYKITHLYTQLSHANHQIISYNLWGKPTLQKICSIISKLSFSYKYIVANLEIFPKLTLCNWRPLKETCSNKNLVLSFMLSLKLMLVNFYEVPRGDKLYVFWNVTSVLLQTWTSENAKVSRLH